MAKNDVSRGLSALQDKGKLGLNLYRAQGSFIGEPVDDSLLVLAAQRTYRKDPLKGFDRYTGGWNIKKRHYWAVSKPKLDSTVFIQ